MTVLPVPAAILAIALAVDVARRFSTREAP